MKKPRNAKVTHEKLVQGPIPTRNDLLAERRRCCKMRDEFDMEIKRKVAKNKLPRGFSPEYITALKAQATVVGCIAGIDFALGRCYLEVTDLTGFSTADCRRWLAGED